jgi:NADH-quinone oxidoreductase subunit I
MVIHVRDRLEKAAHRGGYLPALFGGLRVTWRLAWAQLMSAGVIARLRGRGHAKPVQAHAPAQHGQHRLLARDDGAPRCVACYLCATACPSDCIHIVAAEADTEPVEKYPAAFEIDMLRCIHCGLCVQACPEDAIRMDTGLHTPPYYSRDDAVMGRVDLLALVGGPGAPAPFGAQETREGKRPIG